MHILYFILLFFFTTPALADLKVCNDTDNTSGVAVGFIDNNEWVSEGWWHISPSDCSTVIEGDVQHKDYYLFAEDQETREIWAGEIYLCTSNIEFKIRGNNNCYVRGFEKSGFFKINTNNNTNWQVRLKENNKSP